MHTPDVMTPDRLAARFESIGDNCEFGFVQRACGAEPYDLFRFTACSIESIIDVVATGASRLFSPDDLNIYCQDDEYLIKSHHYSDFMFHTLVSPREVSLEEFKAKRVQRLHERKQQFFDGIRSGEKIYVRKGGESIVLLRQLHQELRRYGPCRLLCVAEADRFHPTGTVERIGPDLWRGYIGTFKNFGKPDAIDIESWFRIMSVVASECDRGIDLPVSGLIAKGQRWITGVGCVARVGAPNDGVANSSDLCFSADQTTRHDHIVASEDIVVTLESDVILTLSAWIKLDRNFEGSNVQLGVDGRPSVHTHPADLARREVWQRIWTSFRSVAGESRYSLSILAGVALGSALTLGGWTIERSPVPGDNLLGLRQGDSASLSLRLRRWFRKTRANHAPHDSNAILRLSNEAMTDGSFIEADDLLANRLKDAPDEPRLLKQFALSAHNSGRHAAAIARWHMAVQADPDDPMCHAGLACNFREYAIPEHANYLITQALDRFPDDATVLSEAARIATARGCFAEAVSLWRKAISLHGPHEAWINNRNIAQTQAIASANLAP